MFVKAGVEQLVMMIDTVVMCKKADTFVYTCLLDIISRTTNE